jgi:hypothetical protein
MIRRVVFTYVQTPIMNRQIKKLIYQNPHSATCFGYVKMILITKSCVGYLLIGVCMYINLIKTQAFLFSFFVVISTDMPISVAARSNAWVYGCLLGLPVRIPPGAWTSVSYDFCVLSARGLCVGPIAY